MPATVLLPDLMSKTMFAYAVAVDTVAIKELVNVNVYVDPAAVVRASVVIDPENVLLVAA